MLLVVLAILYQQGFDPLSLVTTEVKRVLVEALRNVSSVRADPAPDCVIRDFADSSITYSVLYWINDYTRHTKVESEVRTQIWYAARRAELEIPFSIRKLHWTLAEGMASMKVHRRGSRKQSQTRRHRQGAATARTLG